eukprot:418702-Pelagomonas_calceolata.AAC.2
MKATQEERGSLLTPSYTCSEDHGGVALHACDIIRADTGAYTAQLFDYNLPTISPVNKPHPTRDLIVSGSSRQVAKEEWRSIACCFCTASVNKAATVSHALADVHLACPFLNERGHTWSLFLWSRVADDEDDVEEGAAVGPRDTSAAESSAAPGRHRLQPRIPFTLYDADPDSEKKKPKGGKGKGKGKGSDTGMVYVCISQSGVCLVVSDFGAPGLHGI